jgi:hypothetical protein
LAIFNKRHRGFINKPTDHYFRPFVIAAEELMKVKKKDNIAICLGRSIYLDHILVYLDKMQSVHENDPFFAVLFFNSFTDKQLSMTPFLGKRLTSQYLKDILKRSENDTIFIITSDRGTRLEENQVSLSSD